MEVMKSLSDVVEQEQKQEEHFHVLAVDDSVIDRKLLERLLKGSSYKVTCVDSGDEALKYIGLVNHHEDLNSLDSSSSASPYPQQQQQSQVELQPYLLKTLDLQPSCHSSTDGSRNLVVEDIDNRGGEKGINEEINKGSMMNNANNASMSKRKAVSTETSERLPKMKGLVVA